MKSEKKNDKYKRLIGFKSEKQKITFSSNFSLKTLFPAIKAKHLSTPDYLNWLTNMFVTITHRKMT